MLSCGRWKGLVVRRERNGEEWDGWGRLRVVVVVMRDKGFLLLGNDGFVCCGHGGVEKISLRASA